MLKTYKRVGKINNQKILSVMKKNVLALSALLVALVASSFTTSKFATVYFKYNINSTTAPNEQLMSNYSVVSTSPGDLAGTTYIHWFQGQAAIPTAPTTTEFQNSFDAIDNTLGGTVAGRLSDETDETTVKFEKRNALP
jgi:hypothetical protein